MSRYIGGLKPFFTFFGGKWRAAPYYPAPRYDCIVEPFAGAAGYAVRHYSKQIILVEKDARIAALWRYLIATSAEEILRLPLTVKHTDDLGVCPAARNLIGFWLNKGTSAPCKQPSAWMRRGLHVGSFWGEKIRARIAEQVPHIRHWTVIEGDYSCAPDLEATWFIDPPYEKAGANYRCGAKGIDYSQLAEWTRQRRGQVVACENLGARWLPFKFFRNIKTTEGKRGKAVSVEAVWESAT